MSNKILIIFALFLMASVFAMGGLFIAEKYRPETLKQTAQTIKNSTSNLLASSSQSLGNVFKINKVEKENNKAQSQDNLENNPQLQNNQFNTQINQTNTDNLTDVLSDNLINASLKNQDISNLESLNLDQEQEKYFSPSNNFEIKTISADKQSNKKYLQEIYEILDIALPEFNASDIEIVAQAMQSGQYNNLEYIIAGYRTAYEQIKNLKVPANLINIHQQQLIIYSQMDKILTALRQHKQDPVKALIALKTYQEILPNLINLLQEIVTIKQRLSQT